MKLLTLLGQGVALWPVVKAWTWVLPALFLALRERHIRRHLPPAVNRWLNDPVLKSMLKGIAERSDLDNEAKRAAAADRIETYLHDKGIELPGHLVNLILELLVARLHKEGVL